MRTSEPVSLVGIPLSPMWPMSAPSWLLLCSLLCPFSYGETILLFRALCASLVLAWDQPALPGALDALCKRHVITKTSGQVQMNFWLLFPFLLFTSYLHRAVFVHVYDVSLQPSSRIFTTILLLTPCCPVNPLILQDSFSGKIQK